MQDRIAEFAGLLRQNGVRVSIAETLDALAAVRVTSLAEGDSFRSAIRSTMVKRASDIPAFERLFDIHFHGLGNLIRQAERAAREALSMSDSEFNRFLQRVEEFLKEHGSEEMSELTQALLMNRAGQLDRMIRDAARRAELDRIERSDEENRFVRALARELGLERMDAELGDLQGQIDQLEDEMLREQLDEYIEARRRALEDLIRRHVRIERARRDGTLRESEEAGTLADRSFFYLGEDELARMSDAVTMMARRLKSAIAMRRKRSRRGRFDIKRTLRINMKNGGTPFILRFERRRRDKPQIVVLCDVSDSVRNASRFMLQFVYALQDLYSRVRSFIFVAEIGEVTRQFREGDPKTALDAALGGDIINVYAHSNFGNAFRSFVDEHLAAVNRRTTVIVLGDARNNYNLPHERALREIRRRAQRLIWLNPESRGTWGFGDSEMERYSVHCNVVEECRNLNQLYRVIDRLAPR